MSLKDFMKNIFSGRTEEKKSDRPTLIDQIIQSMDLLLQKTDSLNDTYAEEKSALNKIFGEVKSFSPVQDIASAKYEQDILGKITATSTECDAVISGKQGANLKKPIAALQISVTSRLSIQERA